MKKNKKEKFVDDGRTIYNMDVDGLPNRRNKNKIYVTKEEKNNIFLCDCLFVDCLCFM